MRIASPSFRGSFPAAYTPSLFGPVETLVPPFLDPPTLSGQRLHASADMLRRYQ